MHVDIKTRISRYMAQLHVHKDVRMKEHTCTSVLLSVVQGPMDLPYVANNEAIRCGMLWHVVMLLCTAETS